MRTYHGFTFLLVAGDVQEYDSIYADANYGGRLLYWQQ